EDHASSEQRRHEGEHARRIRLRQKRSRRGDLADRRAGEDPMNKREVITSPKVATTGLPYAPAVRVGDLVFVAGQVALGADGKAMEGDITAQTEAVIARISGLLEAAGTSLGNAVENICFLADVRRDFAAFNAVYGKY